MDYFLSVAVRMNIMGYREAIENRGLTLALERGVCSLKIHTYKSIVSCHYQR